MIATLFPRLRPQTAGMLLVLGAAVLWSSNGMFIKLLTVGPLTVTGLRALVAGLVLAPTIRARHFRNGWPLAVVLVSYAVLVLCFVTATKWTTAANAIAIQSTSPGWVFLFTALAERKLAARLVPPQLAILAGIGIFLLEPAHGTSFHGNLVALVAGVTFAVFTMAYARLRHPGIGIISLCNLLTFGALWAIRPQAFPFAQIVPTDWLMLLYLGSVQVGLAFCLFTQAMLRIPPTQVAVLCLLEPLLNPVWVYLAVGEAPSTYGYTGAVAVLCGIVWDSLLRHRAPPPLRAEAATVMGRD
ncbi:MAG: DMT family transporter [Candidatus Lambdaproteobacteria bacterium]|nr:DMT family transporter [Candidatus Lambdaproteobacteria bacterium]